MLKNSKTFIACALALSVVTGCTGRKNDISNSTAGINGELVAEESTFQEINPGGLSEKVEEGVEARPTIPDPPEEVSETNPDSVGEDTGQEATPQTIQNLKEKDNEDQSETTQSSKQSTTSQQTPQKSSDTTTSGKTTSSSAKSSSPSSGSSKTSSSGNSANTSTNKDTGTGSTTSKGTNQSGTAKNNTETKSSSAEKAHTHTWVPVYKTVHHEGTAEQGHYETVVTGKKWVVDKAAWDEQEMAGAYICQKCGWYTFSDGEELDLHIKHEHNWEASYTSGRRPTGNVIHHAEEGHYEDVTEQKWVVDKEATSGWDEEVIDYYKCSICGAKK